MWTSTSLSHCEEDLKCVGHAGKTETLQELGYSQKVTDSY